MSKLGVEQQFAYHFPYVFTGFPVFQISNRINLESDDRPQMALSTGMFQLKKAAGWGHAYPLIV